MTFSYTYCTTVNAVESSLQTLRQAQVLIVDCEGRVLGSRNGALSTISIGTSNPSSKIFVYDAVKLDRSALKKVLDLLSDHSVKKVMWDGRKDFSEIYHTYGSKIENVLDLQIAEVVSRPRCGQWEFDREGRIKSFLKPYRVFPDQKEYEDIHIVVGMKRCLNEHGLAIGDGKDVYVTRIHEANLSELWMKRPLNDTLCKYAAKDIHLIWLIYALFKRRGFLSPERELLAQSRRYVSMHGDLALKPLEGDRFQNHPVLLLDILDAPIGVARRECDSCHRSLSMGCFMQRERTHTVACRVCHVVSMKFGTPLAQRYR